MDKQRAAEWVGNVMRERAERAFEDAGGGLRERKKAQMRQTISDTATMLFLDHGFEGVRVAEIADACGVSEKTVFNYFPTKESLVLDREEEMIAEVRRAVAPQPGRSLVEGAVEVILENTRALFTHLEEDHVGPEEIQLIRRFIEMIEGTPALRGAHRDMQDRLAQVAAEALAERAGVNPEDPEPQMAAAAIIGLWEIGMRSTSRHTGAGLPPAEARDAVISDVRRAARLIDTGLWCFGAMAQGGAQREQLRVAAASVDDARRQVVAAIRRARTAWRALKAEAEARHH